MQIPQSDNKIEVSATGIGVECFCSFDSFTAEIQVELSSQNLAIAPLATSFGQKYFLVYHCRKNQTLDYWRQLCEWLKTVLED